MHLDVVPPDFRRWERYVNRFLPVRSRSRLSARLRIFGKPSATKNVCLKYCVANSKMVEPVLVSRKGQPKPNPRAICAPAPNSLAIAPNAEGVRGRSDSESSISDQVDSGVCSTASRCSSLDNIGPVSPLSSDNGNKLQKKSNSPPPLPSSTDIASPLPNAASKHVSGRLSTRTVSTTGSDKTVTEERVLRDQQLRHAELAKLNSQYVSDVTSVSSSESNSSQSICRWVSSVILSSGLSTECASTSQSRVTPIDEFVLCTRHSSTSEHFCWNCIVDGCYACMLEGHGNHKIYESITCYNLLQREEVVTDQMDTCLKCLSNVTNRIGYFQSTVLHGVVDWQKKLGLRENKLRQIQFDFEQHLSGLYSIRVEAESEFTSFKRMMSGLRRLYYNHSLIEIHDNANPIRRSLVNLQGLSVRATQAMTNAVLSETGGRNVLSDIIKTSGMEMLTYTPLSALEKLDVQWKTSMKRGPKAPPLFRCSPDTQAPDIPSALKPLFCGRSPPSPTICDSFTFARMDPIASSARAHGDSNWPSKQDQVQMAHFDAVSQLLRPEPSIWSKVNSPDCIWGSRTRQLKPSTSTELCPEPRIQPAVNANCKWKPRTPQQQPSTSAEVWIPRTPQPQLSNLNEFLAEPPVQKCQSLMAMWDRAEQSAPSVLPHFQKPQTPQLGRNPRGRAFEIGYLKGRHYSLMKTPILKLEGKNKDDPAMLCRPWGICCDKQNLIYIADRSHNRIAIFSIEGKFVHAFGREGDQPGEFNRPAGLTFDVEGRLLVADKDNHRIQVFTPDGQYLFHFGQHGSQPGEFFYPWDVACNSIGHIAVSDSRNHRIQIFTLSGEFIRKYGWENKPAMWRHLDMPRGVIYVKNNVLLVTDFNNHRIVQLTFCDNDKVYACQFNRTNGKKEHVLCRPQGLTLDVEGNVLVCDSRNDRIMILSPKGEYVNEFGKHGSELGQFERPVDISVSADGEIAIVDLHHNRVQIF